MLCACWSWVLRGLARGLREGGMGFYYKCALRLWFALTLLSFAVDAVCYWLAQTSPAPIPGQGGVNYIAIFLVSAPTPFVLAIAIALLSGVLALLRGIALGALGLRRALRPAKVGRDYAAEPSLGLASSHKS